MSRALFIAALLLASLPARAADDNEPAPRILSKQDAAERRLMAQSKREGLAAVSLLSSGGMLAMGGLASFLGLMLGGGSDSSGLSTSTSHGMLTAAYPAAISMGAVGLAAIVAGSVLAYESKVHKRRSSAYVISASSLSWRF